MKRYVLVPLLLTLVFSCKKESESEPINDTEVVSESRLLEFNYATNSLNEDGQPYYRGNFSAYNDQKEFQMMVNKNTTYHFSAVNDDSRYYSSIEILILNAELDTVTIGSRDLYFTPAINQKLHIKLKLTSIQNESLAFNFHVETTEFTALSILGIPMECRGDWTVEANDALSLQLHNSKDYRIVRPLANISDFNSLTFTIKAKNMRGQPYPNVGVCFGGSYTFSSNTWDNYAYSLPEVGTLVTLEDNTSYGYSHFRNNGSSSSGGTLSNADIESGINFRLQKNQGNDVTVYVNNVALYFRNNIATELNTLYFLVKEDGYSTISFEDIKIN
jgi:hypothetical protein